MSTPEQDGGPAGALTKAISDHLGVVPEGRAVPRLGDVPAVLRALHDAGWAIRRREPVVNPVILEGTTRPSGIHVRLERGAAPNLLRATIDGVEVKVVGHTTFRDGGTQHIDLEGGGRIHISSPLRPGGGPPTYNGEVIA